MKYFAIYTGGHDDDKALFGQVRTLLRTIAHRRLYDDKEQCLAVQKAIEQKLPMGYGLITEWLNGWDDPMQESVVLSIARSKTLPYSIGCIHFYKIRTSS